MKDGQVPTPFDPRLCFGSVWVEPTSRMEGDEMVLGGRYVAVGPLGAVVIKEWDNVRLRLG